MTSVQHPVIAVAVQARGRDQRGQTLDQLQRCQPQLGTPIGLRLIEAIDERILAELLEALQRQRAAARNSAAAVPGRRVGAFDADRRNTVSLLECRTCPECSALVVRVRF